MRHARFLLGIALVGAVGCDPLVDGRLGLGRDGTGIGTGSGSRALIFTVQPNTIFMGQTMPDVEVSARDGSGARDTSFTGSITLAIGRNAGGGVLTGTTRAPAAAGVARFGGLTINRPGTGYTLTATASGATNATSAAFDVVPVPRTTISTTP